MCPSGHGSDGGGPLLGKATLTTMTTETVKMHAFRVCHALLMLYCAVQAVVGRTTDRAGRAPTRPLCDTRPSGGWASFSFFWSGRAGGRRLKIHAGPGGWAVNFSIGRPWASPVFLRILPRAELRTPIPILMDLKAI